MNMIKTAIAAAALAFALTTVVSAQTPPAASTATKPATTTTAPAVAAKPAKAPKVAKAPAKPKSEASIACSKDADTKGLHGKDRKKFRETCMKTAAGKSKSTAATTAVPKVETKK